MAQPGWVSPSTTNSLMATVNATAGQTATYLREVIRRAALMAADRDNAGDLRVDQDMLTSAAHELLEDRAALTQAISGGVEEPDAEPPLSDSPPRTVVPVPPVGAMVSRSGMGGSFCRLGRCGTASQPPSPPRSSSELTVGAPSQNIESSVGYTVPVRRPEYTQSCPSGADTGGLSVGLLPRRDAAVNPVS
jgi:hypothetical protein